MKVYIAVNTESAVVGQVLHLRPDCVKDKKFDIIETKPENWSRKRICLACRKAVHKEATR